MSDSKALPLVGGVMLVFFLPLLIVIALLVGVMSGMGSAAACTPSTTTEASGMAWPTDKKEAAQGWDDEGPEQHKGMDFDVPKGSKVYAVESGARIVIELVEPYDRKPRGDGPRHRWVRKPAGR